MIKKQTEITFLSFKVRLSECDPYKIAHHANYVIWFETARLHAIEHHRNIIADFKNNKSTDYFTSQTKCKFTGFVTYNDEIEIRTKITCLDVPAMYHFLQEITNVRTGEKVAKCETINMILEE